MQSPDRVINVLKEKIYSSVLKVHRQRSLLCLIISLYKFGLYSPKWPCMPHIAIVFHDLVFCIPAALLMLIDRLLTSDVMYHQHMFNSKRLPLDWRNHVSLPHSNMHMYSTTLSCTITASRYYSLILIHIPDDPLVFLVPLACIDVIAISFE